MEFQQLTKIVPNVLIMEDLKKEKEETVNHRQILDTLNRLLENKREKQHEVPENLMLNK